MSAVASPFEVIANHLFDPTNFYYARNEIWGSNYIVPLSTSVIFLTTIFSLRMWMNTRKEPFNLKPYVVIHNYHMFLLSLVMLVAQSYFVYDIFKRHGYDFEVLFCDSERKEVRTGGLYFWLYMFYMSKIYELLDTVFLVLRKKPLTFLHVYHHAITLVLCWVELETDVVAQWCATILNAAVHVPMYYYYFLTSIGETVWWKKYITMFQIAQFVLVLSLSIVSYVWHYGFTRNCVGRDMWGNEFGMFVIFSYLALFINFFVQTYTKNTRGKHSSGATKNTDNNVKGGAADSKTNNKSKRQ
mmetsp:Transcript_3590/g.8646  ORF Transcript_3590/g.8646 Transcript_3590/m.8646 type:complete len:300 (-) Transcript_3590:123-1022(-)|eukprot:CAMPEP_0174240442 /NCGR_PEP_ID=MMETSP0417-20130205/18841_1 /TAXON_ID=242541 /ORGANISM="Mayorella sp, Strain BSH-02190019" /LENGTH=299 /DNA_ID=CAMNT_0015319533 /DNA_START=36 /DNA_END=935 /DNA_ORIENTATION=-